MSNSVGNLFILAIVLAGSACCLLNAKKFFKNNSIVRKIVKKLLPKVKSREYKSLSRLLEKCSLNMNVLDVYIIKVGAVVIASVFLFLIFITNTQVKQKQVFNTPLYSTYSQNDFHNNSVARLKNFNLLKRHIIITGISNNAEGLNAVKNVLSKYSDVDSDKINDSAAVTVKDIISLENLYSPSRKVKYGLYAIVFFFVPDLLFKLYSIVIGRRKEEEVYNLVNLIVMISTNPNVTSKNILKALIENSYYLRSYLKEFESNYIAGRLAAYDKFLSEEKYKCISKIISALRHIEESTRTSTVYNLKSGNESIEKSRKINYENKIEKKEGIAFSIFIVGVCVLIKIIMDVSIAGISSMGNINL